MAIEIVKIQVAHRYSVRNRPTKSFTVPTGLSLLSQHDVTASNCIAASRNETSDWEITATNKKFYI